MQDTYNRLAKEIISASQSIGSDEQLLIGIAGPPGGGKSTTAERLAERIPNSIIVPMDGYHFTKERLSQFPDPVSAFARRGAHWTFDGEAFVAALTSLREKKTGMFPAFSHGVGDPVENSIEVRGPAEHKVVIVEGNYLLLDISPWDKITSILNFTYFIDCDLQVVEQRIYKRHMSVGRNTAERAWERVTTNDSPNAQLIFANKNGADAIIQSL